MNNTPRTPGGSAQQAGRQRTQRAAAAAAAAFPASFSEHSPGDDLAVVGVPRALQLHPALQHANHARHRRLRVIEREGGGQRQQLSRPCKNRSRGRSTAIPTMHDRHIHTKRGCGMYGRC